MGRDSDRQKSRAEWKQKNFHMKNKRNEKNKIRRTRSEEMEIIVDINSDHAMGSNYFYFLNRRRSLFVYFDMCRYSCFVHDDDERATK